MWGTNYLKQNLWPVWFQASIVLQIRKRIPKEMSYDFPLRMANGRVRGLAIQL